ncbi:MAG: type II toxin-antitoxin system Phd/YefM family antitoxin [Thermoanaerobaculia bacterium]
MRAVTIREAKAHLNELVEAANRGEQVVLLRGSRHVAAIVPISAEDLELSPRLSDSQADRLWRQLAAERNDGSMLVFDAPEDATAYLSRRSGVRRGGGTRSAAPKGRVTRRSR